MCWPCVCWQKRAISYHLLILVQHMSISITEVDPQPDSLHNSVVKPKNSLKILRYMRNILHANKQKYR